MSDRLTVLTSKSVFTGTEDQPFEGFVAVRGNRIEPSVALARQTRFSPRQMR